MKRMISIIALTFAVLLSFTSQMAAQSAILPGQSLKFPLPIGSDAGRSNDTLASSTAITSEYAVKAGATASVAQVTAFALLYNDFKVSGETPRAVGAEITAGADWDGTLTAVGLVLSKARVRIRLTLIDLNDNNRAVAEAAILDKEITNTLGAGDLARNEVGSQTVDLQTNVIRGHSYRVIFRIDCEASGGVGASGSDFAGGNRKAKLSDLNVRIANDNVELLETIREQVSLLVDDVATVRTIVSRLDDKVMAVNNKLDARLDVAVSTRASQESVNQVQNTTNIINAKIDDLAAKLMALQRDALRSQIEAALVEGDRYNVTWYQMPQSAGGYLELARSIVAESIEEGKKAGLPTSTGSSVNQAERELGIGDVFYRAKSYKDAYDHFRAAYLHLSIVPGNHRP